MEKTRENGMRVSDVQLDWMKAPYHTIRLSSAVLLCLAMLCVGTVGAQEPSRLPPASGVRIEAILPPIAVPGKPESHKSKYSLKIEQAGWFDTGIPVRAGETLNFEASGSVSLSDGRTVTPEGLSHGWRDMLRQLAAADANTGALIGRIGGSPAAVPFVIGTSSQVTARQDGHLYLCVNLPNSLFSSGQYKINVRFSGTPSALSSGRTDSIAATLPVEIFAQIPRRVEDADRRPGDVVNFALIGTEQQVTDAFRIAGWVGVDKSVDEAIINGLFATLERRPYVAVPMSVLYLFGRPQDMSYARADAIRVAAVRHHLRLWKTEFTVNGTTVWVGSATHDNGFERDERDGGITHRIDEKIDEERDFIRDSFQSGGSVASAAYVTPADPVTEARTATGGAFTSDGRILVLQLR